MCLTPSEIIQATKLGYPIHTTTKKQFASQTMAGSGDWAKMAADKPNVATGHVLRNYIPFTVYQGYPLAPTYKPNAFRTMNQGNCEPHEQMNDSIHTNQNDRVQHHC